MHFKVSKSDNLLYTKIYFLFYRTYLVIAPRLIRAGQVYRIVVNILEPSPTLVVRATIYRDNIELAAVEHECESVAPQVLAIMVSKYLTFKTKH